jgi:hypothetical protein
MPLTFTETEESPGTVEGSPSCPSALLPQHRIVPSASRVQAWLYPAATETAFEMPLTATGTREIWSNVPSPRCPFSPNPQQLTVPSVSSAHPNSSPAATRVIVVKPLTGVSVDESDQVPLASCPNWLRPAHSAVPSDRRTQEYSPPDETPVGTTAPLAVNCRV